MLTHTEFALLECLMKKAGWVFTRNQLIDAIKGENYFITDRSIDVIMVALRKKLGMYASFIETIRSVGYRFKTSC